MRRGPRFEPGDLEEIAREFGLPPSDDAHAAAVARRRGEGPRGRRERAPQRRAGHADLLHQRPPLRGRRGTRARSPRRCSARSATASTPPPLDFVRWAPSTGLLLLAGDGARDGGDNSPLGPGVRRLVEDAARHPARRRSFALPLVDWVNHGLLTLFFLVVGLEIKREFTVGRLAIRRRAALPIAAALGGMVAARRSSTSSVIPAGAARRWLGHRRSRPTPPSPSR